METKKINTFEYISVLKELVESGETVSVLIAGKSMRPFLKHNRDTVVFHKPVQPLKKGDIVFYQRTNGEFVLHRILKQYPNHTFDIIGDSQITIEKVEEKQIFAIVTKIHRKDKWITPKSPIWIFFSKIWIHTIPLRKLAYAIYGVLMKR